MVCCRQFFCCHDCFEIFQDRKSLSDHQKIFSHRKQRIVTKKATPSKSRKQSAKHEQKETDNVEKVYHCDECNKVFYRLGIYNKHRKVHVKKYRCPYIHLGCNRSFATKKDLRIHERIHCNERCEICSFCLRGFTDPAALRKHIKYVHEMDKSVSSKQYVCRECKKQFARKDSLQKHWQIHAKKEERATIKCDVCNVSFTFRCNYFKHKRLYH
mmetsp:Transcript_74746/g.118941  ORF Transcript_74746/g.118941 Transcript_74746/m.118941 type:complete len:213 (-) Transcript_74746:22-660(-)